MVVFCIERSNIQCPFLGGSFIRGSTVIINPCFLLALLNSHCYNTDIEIFRRRYCWYPKGASCHSSPWKCGLYRTKRWTLQSSDKSKAGEWCMCVSG